MPTIANPFHPEFPITFHEEKGSPDESQVSRDGKVRRTFILDDYTHRMDFVKLYLGTSRIIQEFDDAGNLISGSVLRDIPAGYVLKNRTVFEDTDQFVGDLPDSYYFYATDVESMTGQGEIVRADIPGQDDGWFYKKCKVTLTYSAPNYRVISDQDMIDRGYFKRLEQADGSFISVPDEASLKRYVTKFSQPVSQYITIPYGQYFYPDGSTVSYSYGRVQTSAEVMYVWHQVPVVPTAARTHVGSINAFSFDFSKANANPYHRGTLLLTSVHTTPYRQPGGGRVWDIMYKMTYFNPKEQGWNVVASKVDTDVEDLSDQGGHNYLLRSEPIKTGGIITAWNNFYAFIAGDYTNTDTQDKQQGIDKGHTINS